MRAQSTMENRIGAWRVYRGYTQTVLGRAVGVSHTTIHKWERGTAMPSPNQLFQLCMILQCGRKDLYPS